MKLSDLGKKELSIDNAVDISGIVSEHTTQQQFDALTSLATAIGIEAFSRSALLRKHNSGCYQCAQGQFLAWCRKPGDREQRQREREIYYYGYEQGQ